jgi:hypothetical protein
MGAAVIITFLGYGRDVCAIGFLLCLIFSALTVAHLVRKARIEDRQDAELAAFLNELDEKERD